MNIQNYQIPRRNQYYYKILNQSIIMNCSHIIEGNTEKVVVYFEHIVGEEMHTASCILPDLFWVDKADFSEKDIKYFEEKIKEEQEELFCYARKPGKMVSEKEAQEIEQLLYPDGRRYSYESIAEYTESVLVTEFEKESIVTQIGSYVPKPSKVLMSALMVLPIVALLCVIYAALRIGSVLAMVAFIGFVLATIALIGIYFLCGVCFYDIWKRDVKGIRSHKVYKMLVIPCSVWQSQGFYKNCYMTIATQKGLPFFDTHLISKELYQNIDNMNVWAYFYEDPREIYQGKYRIFLVGKNKECSVDAR